MSDWWTDVEQEVLACLDGNGATPVADIARRLAIPESAAVSLVAHMAREGKIHIRTVQAVREGAEDA
jgi:DNA-binding Lrp family transcriptional regulator